MEAPFQKITQLLDENGISYQLFQHEPVFTSEQLAKARNITEDAIAKSLLLKTNLGFVLAVLPGNRRVDTKKIKSCLKVKELRFAKPEEVREIMGCEVGACYPFGNILGVRTVIDQRMEKNETININPGIHDKTLVMTWDQFKAVYGWEIADISIVRE